MQFSYPRVEDLNPFETMASLSAYRLIELNREKDSMIIFGIRFAAATCRGARSPSSSEVYDLLQSIGQYYRGYFKGRATPLEFLFANEALHSNRATGNSSQAIESAWKRFEQHDIALQKKVGFNIANAIYISTGLMHAVEDKMQNTREPKRVKLTKSQYYDFSYYVRPEERLVRAWSNAIKFQREEIEALFPSLGPKVGRYLDMTSISIEEFPALSDPLDVDTLFESPVITLGENYVIPVPHYLLHGLPLRLHRELSDDSGYRGQYLGKKGGILEEWAAEELRLILRPGEIFRKKKYEDRGGRAEADIIVSYGDYLIFVECTTKWVGIDAWRGTTPAVYQILTESISKCYKQALRAKSAYLDGRLSLPLQNIPRKILVMVVTDSFYPNLLIEHSLARQANAVSYLSRMIEGQDYPYIVNIHDLETLRRLTDADLFMRFVLERLWMYEHPIFLAHDEFDYFILFTKKEYQEIKDTIIKSGTTLNYVGHVPPPSVLSPLFLECLEILGTDSFGIIKAKDAYSPELAASTFGLIYQLYNTWRGAEHLVFDSKGYDQVVSRYREQGVKCRALVWEGLEEYIGYLKLIGNREEATKLRKKLDEGGFAEDLGILIVNPTDMYRTIYRSLIESNENH